MRQIVFVSFPRSGHHLLIEMLAKYFDYDNFKDFDFQESLNYTKPLQIGKYIYCEKYIMEGHKDNFIENNAHWYKTHDCALDNEKYERKITNDETKFYIIQYRDFIPTFYSLYKKFRNHNSQEFYQTLEDYVSYWQKFIRKWIIYNINPNKILISYKNLISSKEILSKIIKFINPNEEIDYNKINEILKIIKPETQHIYDHSIMNYVNKVIKLEREYLND